MMRLDLPSVWLELPARSDFVLFSVHLAVSHGHLSCWLYVAGFGGGIDW